MKLTTKGPADHSFIKRLNQSFFLLHSRWFVPVLIVEFFKIKRKSAEHFLREFFQPNLNRNSNSCFCYNWLDSTSFWLYNQNIKARGIYPTEFEFKILFSLHILWFPPSVSILLPTLFEDRPQNVFLTEPTWIRWGLLCPNWNIDRFSVLIDPIWHYRKSAIPYCWTITRENKENELLFVDNVTNDLHSC